MIKASWFRIVNTGIYDDMPGFLKREIILTNQISLIVALIFLLSPIDPIVWSENILIFDIAFSFALCLFILWLNSRKKYVFSRLVACVFLLSLQLIAFIVLGVKQPVYYKIFPFVIIGYLLFALLVIDYKREKKIFVPVVVFNFLTLLFYDRLFDSFNAGFVGSGEPGYLLYKSYQFFLWVVLLLMIIFLKAMNRIFEQELQDSNTQLKLVNEKNYEQIKEISAQNEEIVAQNEELVSQQEQLSEQREFIENQNEELRAYQKELKDYIFRITKTKSLLAEKEAENRSILKVLRKKFRTIVFDIHGNILSISPLVVAGMGINEDDLIGQNVHEVFGSSMTYPKEFDFEAFWRKILNEELVTQDFAFQMGEQKIAVRSTYSVILNNNHEIAKVISISEDITSLVNHQKLIEEKREKLELQKREIEEKNEELEQQKEEIEAINETLEERVKERTEALEKQNKQLAEYAFINAHLLRAPVSSILGLINLLNYEKVSEEEKEIFFYLSRSVNQLDKIVFKINNAIQQNTVFDRDFLKE